jgi:hypothetical protein
MPVDTRINIPFIPQEGITGQILQALQLANEHHQQQQQLGIQQQQANTQQQQVSSESDLRQIEGQDMMANLQAGMPKAQVDALNATTQATNLQNELHRVSDPVTESNTLAQLRSMNARLQFMGLPTVPEPGQTQQAAPTGPSPVSKMMDRAISSLGHLSGDENSAITAANADMMMAGGDPKALSDAIKDIASNRRSMALANAYIGQKGELAGQARSDRAFQFTAQQIEKYAQPLAQWEQRAGRLKDTLSQNTAQADALVAPELLSIMAGGAGSGVRMNEAEIARIVGGRTAYESLEANLNKYSLDPQHFSIPPEQRAAAMKLLDSVSDKVSAKQAVIDGARQSLVDAGEPEKMKQIYADTLQKLTKIDSGTPIEGPAKAPDIPARPKGVPDNANWNPDARTWSIP